MANQPHPDKQAVTWRLHRDLVAATQAAARARGETVLAFVTRALERETAAPPDDVRRELALTRLELDNARRQRDRALEALGSVAPETAEALREEIPAIGIGR